MKQATQDKKVVINGRPISRDFSPYVIAEMSGNHNQDINRAKQLIFSAKEAGADAVKLQTYRADTITIKSNRPEFIIQEGLWKGRSLYELYEEAHTPWEWHPELFDYARALEITIFSSPFDDTAVDFLESLNAPAYKIASAEVIDWGLIEKVASTGKPVIISSGMASDIEIEEALSVLRQNGCNDVILLHCISSYPTPIADANLGRINYLADKFNLLTGLSDHSMGLTAGIASVSLGAVVVEKHFTLSRADGGVDSAFSLEKEELAEFCLSISDAYLSVGNGAGERPGSESHNRQFRRSLYFVEDIKAGEVIKDGQVKSIRPGMGIMPRYLKQIIGSSATTYIRAGTPVSWDLIDKAAPGL